MADNMQNTAAMIGQASTVKKYNDIPIDVLPDSSFGRLYAPGTKTLGGKSLDENTRQYDLDLQESKRASLVKEALAQKEYEEMVRSNKADEAYKWAALNRGGGSGGGSSSLSATEMLNAIRNGAVQYAQDLINNPKTFTVKRGLLKGQTAQESPYTPEMAAKTTSYMLQNQLGNLPISSSNYNDIIKSVYNSLGLQVPGTSSNNSSSDTAELEKYAAQLGGQ